MSTVLPSLPPLADDYRVAVCAACKMRSCLLECHRCASRKNGDPGQLEFTVAELRASGSKEHHSYWRSQPGENFDMPHGVDDLREMAEQQRKRHTEKPFEGWSLEEKYLGTCCCGDCERLAPGVESFGKAGVNICSICDRRASTAHVSVEDRDRLILAYVAKNGGPS